MKATIYLSNLIVHHVLLTRPHVLLVLLVLALLVLFVLLVLWVVFVELNVLSVLAYAILCMTNSGMVQLPLFIPSFRTK